MWTVKLPAKTAKFGGPALSMLRLDLIPGRQWKLLKLSDSILGPAPDPERKRGGWRVVFEEGLKTSVEC